MWNNFKGWLQNIFSAANNRMDNPFLASYVLSLIIINYRIPLYIISEAKIQDKLDFINAENINFTLPLVVALLYTFIYPLISIAFDFILEVLINLRELAILHAKKQTPFGKDRAKQYFSKHHSSSD